MPVNRDDAGAVDALGNHVGGRFQSTAPEYATLAAIGGETLIDDVETKPSRRHRGRVSPAQNINATDRQN
jgi:hypothetical protein